MRVTRRTVLTLPFLATAAQACDRVKIAELPLRLVENYVIVPASLAGQPISLLLDTGAEGMLVTPAMAEALRLPLNGLTRIYGTGGSQQVRVVRLTALRLGDAPMPSQLAPVAPLPLDLPMTPPLAGLLGASLLSRFDLEVDIPGRRIALWSPDSCAGQPGISLPLTLSRASEPFIPVQVNGQTLLAEVDTGSRASILSTAAARRLGLDAPISANTATGVDGTRLPIGHTRMMFALGGDKPEDMPVSISPLQLDRGDMLLGLDQLGRRPFWLNYAAGTAVFGPIR
jgi:predicted aspartyl protease